MSFTERVQAYVREEGLWPEGASLLAAVSGGPDSVALLDVLATALAPAMQLRLAVAHVDHGLRPEAGEDAAFVERLAMRYGLPFLLCRADVPARVAATGESVEEAARNVRYAALQQFAREAGAEVIVTGHTADDQAETVLMRMLRGAGVAGLAGIPPRRENIARPLLSLWRRDILAYLQERGLSYCTDLTNLSVDFTRNRIRQELLPLLEAEYAPRLRERLRNLAEIAREDASALDAWADSVYAPQREAVTGGISLSLALDVPTAIHWRVWRRAIADIRGGLRDIGFEHLEAIRRLPVGQEVHLPGVRVLREAGRLVFLPLTGEEPETAIPETPLPVPGHIVLPRAGCEIMAEVARAFPMAGGEAAVLDAAAVEGALRVRSWQAGDRFRPLCAPGSRKIQDIFVDAGVPRRLREHVPVILDDNGIIWLAGFRIADRVKILPSTTHQLRLSIKWELNPWTMKLSDVA